MSFAAFNPGLRAELARSVGEAAPLWTFANATTDLWWDFSDSSTVTASGVDSSISAVSDKSGNSNGGAQSTASNQPSLISSAHNGLDCARFSHTSAQFLNFASELDEIRTVFWVILRNSSLSNHGINRGLLGHSSTYHWHAYTDGVLQFAASNVKNGTFKLDGSEVDGTSTNIPTSLTVVSILTDGNVEADNFAKDRAFTTTANRNWGGDLGELCVIESAWSTADIQKGEGYLAHKWGLTGNLPSDHPYKSEAPTQ